MNLRQQQTCLSLDGPWECAFHDGPGATEPMTAAEAREAGLPVITATTPGCMELDLVEAGILPEPFHGMNMALLPALEDRHLWYYREFNADDAPGHDAFLVFEGIDCHARVFLNGHLIACPDNMLIEHRIDVTGQLRGHNTLCVHILPAVTEAAKHDAPRIVNAMASNAESLYARKAPHMYGWDIMPRAVSGGIWRSVSLLSLPCERLDDLFIETIGLAEDASRSSMILHWRGRIGSGYTSRYELEVTGVCGHRTFTQRRRILFGTGQFRFDIENPALWWPRGSGEQNLYDVTARLLKDGAEIDSLALTLGVRTVKLDRTDLTDEAGAGKFEFIVNGRRIFILGSNWVPLDAFHCRDISRTEPALELVEDIGCNMVRCWGGNVYESDLFFDLCDRKGIMVWQDFAMACAIYPQEHDFQVTIAHEARAVVRRLRQHASIALWSGDNECDYSFLWGGSVVDPNSNVLTRVVLPEIVRQEDPTRHYLPSSPYISPAAFRQGVHLLPEDHLWGPRDYYKGQFYTSSICHFASETGYHGCPSPDSLARFLSPDKVWPYQWNDEWVLHCTSPVPGVDLFDYRVELMASQVRTLFGTVPDNVADYAFASQVSQAEAMKFFIERFRTGKWRRTGIIWWNILDGWPQLSDAVVDYYFGKKLAYYVIKASQQPLCLALREESDGVRQLVACNDTQEEINLDWTVTDVDTGDVVAQGAAVAEADAACVVGVVPAVPDEQRLLSIAWASETGDGRSHYLAGNPPFDLAWCRAALAKAGVLDGTVWEVA